MAKPKKPKTIRSPKLKLHHKAFAAASKKCFAAGPTTPKAFGTCMKKTVEAEKKAMRPQFDTAIAKYEHDAHSARLSARAAKGGKRGKGGKGGKKK